MQQDLSESMIEDQFSLIPSYVFLPAQPQNVDPDENEDWYVHEIVTYQAEKTDFTPWRAPDTPSVASDIDSIRSDWDSVNNSWHNFSIKTEMDESSTVITTSRSVRKKLSNVLFEVALEQINNSSHNNGTKIRSNSNRLEGIKEHIQEIQASLPSLVWDEEDDLDGTRFSSTASKNNEYQDESSISTEEDKDDKNISCSESNSSNNSKLVLEENSDLDGNRGSSRSEDNNSRNTNEEKDNNKNGSINLELKARENNDDNRDSSMTGNNRINKERTSSNTKKKKRSSKKRSDNSYSNSYSSSHRHSYSYSYNSSGSSNSRSRSHSHSHTYSYTNSNSSSNSSRYSYSNRVGIREVLGRARERRNRLESIRKEIDLSLLDTPDTTDMTDPSYVHHDRKLISSSPVLYAAARRPSWSPLPQPPFCQTNTFSARRRQDRGHRRSHRRVDNHRSNHLNDLPIHTRRYTPSNTQRWPVFSPEQRSMPVKKIPYNLGVLMASAFESASPEIQKMIIGERLYHQVQDLEPDMAGWITSILLESDDCYKLLNLLESPKDVLRDRIDEILGVLEAHEVYGI